MKTLALIKTGTGARWAVRQLQAMAPHGGRALVLVPPGPTADQLDTIPGVTVRRVGTSPDPGNVQVLRQWPAVIRAAAHEFNPDVVHSQFVATTVAARWALRGRATPVVFQVPGPLHLESAWSRQLDIGTARPVDRWIATCEFTRALLVKAGVAVSRVGLAHYGLDASEWEVARSRAALREFGIPESRRVVGMISFVYPPRGIRRRGIKGHEDFIAALRQNIDAGFDVHALMVGGARPGAERYAAAIAREAKRALDGRVSLVSSVADVRPWYAALDVAVHPSLSENLGGAAESMMAAVPTIATTVGGFPDLVREGVTGWLVPPRRPDQLAKTISRVLMDTDHARQVGRAGQAHAQRLLDPTANAQLVWTYLIDAVDQAARGSSGG